jgi:NAD(P)H-dependent FMN reductase
MKVIQTSKVHFECSTRKRSLCKTFAEEVKDMIEAVNDPKYVHMDKRTFVEKDFRD